VPDACGSAPGALDTLAIPAIATDCERTFSSGRKLISPERNRPSDDIIEATECLKAWWDSAIIKQLTLIDGSEVSGLFNKADSEVCDDEDMCILYSHFETNSRRSFSSSLPFLPSSLRPIRYQSLLGLHCMHRQTPLASLGRRCIATVNALAYEESAYLQYFSHLSQDPPRYGRPESLLYDPEIPPWASLPWSASVVRLRPLNSDEDVKYSVIHLCENCPASWVFRFDVPALSAASLLTLRPFRPPCCSSRLLGQHPKFLSKYLRPAQP
jgi:hypothetical protein